MEAATAPGSLVLPRLAIFDSSFLNPIYAIVPSYFPPIFRFPPLFGVTIGLFTLPLIFIPHPYFTTSSFRFGLFFQTKPVILPG